MQLRKSCCPAAEGRAVDVWGMRRGIGSMPFSRMEYVHVHRHG